MISLEAETSVLTVADTTPYDAPTSALAETLCLVFSIVDLVDSLNVLILTVRTVFVSLSTT